MNSHGAEGNGFFALLTDASRSAIRAIGVERRCPAGSPVYGEGLPGDSLAVILAGRVKVVTVTANGSELLLGIRAPGDLLGELSSATGRQRSASVRAIDEVRMLSFPQSAFDDLLDRRPDVSRALMRVLAERVQEGDQHRVRLERPVDARVAEQLLALAERFGVVDEDGATTIDLPLTQDELAGLTWTSRSALAAVLRSLRDDGIVTTTRRRFTVLDLAALRTRI